MNLLLRILIISIFTFLAIGIYNCSDSGKERVAPANSGTGSNSKGNGNGSGTYPYSNIPGNNIFYTSDGRLFIPNVFKNQLISEFGRCDTTSGFYVISGIFDTDTLASFSVYFKTKPTTARNFRITTYRDSSLVDTTVYLLVTDGTLTRKTWRGAKGNVKVQIGASGPTVGFQNIKCENVANYSDTVWASGSVGCK
ncbi:MAG: hypothetical protein SFY32_00915 [Bacteroidota bacterium]|nr:hypothetical protein [Bacteroidota bacterium]